MFAQLDCSIALRILDNTTEAASQLATHKPPFTCCRRMADYGRRAASRRVVKDPQKFRKEEDRRLREAEREKKKDNKRKREPSRAPRARATGEDDGSESEAIDLPSIDPPLECDQGWEVSSAVRASCAPRVVGDYDGMVPDPSTPPLQPLPPPKPSVGGNETSPWPTQTTKEDRLSKTRDVVVHLSGREILYVETHPSDLESTHSRITSCTNEDVITVAKHLSYRGLINLSERANRTRCDMTPAGREFFREVALCIAAGDELIENEDEWTWEQNCSRLQFAPARRCGEMASGYSLDLMKLDEETRQWALRQYELLASGRLRFDRAVQLLDIGLFCGDNFWTRRYVQLADYFVVNKHTNIPEQPDGGDLESLYEWTCEQRQTNRRNLLSAEKAGRLRELRFVFGCNRYGEYEPWGDTLRELLEYRDLHGHCNVPIRSGPLGAWVNNQRVVKDKMSQDRVDLLNSVGFVWDMRDDAWSARFAELQEFRKLHGHCKVPMNNGPLGIWVGKQRLAKSKMSRDRVDLLNSIGFVWNTHDDAWSASFAELQEFRKLHGHCKVPQRKGDPLGRWVKRQRDRKDTRLSQDQIDLLDGIGFVWSRKRASRGKKRAQV